MSRVAESINTTRKRLDEVTSDPGALSDAQVIEFLAIAEAALREATRLDEEDPRPDAHDILCAFRRHRTVLGTEVGNRFAPDRGREFWASIQGRELPYTLAAERELGPGHRGQIEALISRNGPFLWPRGVPLCLEVLSHGEWEPFDSASGWVTDLAGQRNFCNEPVRLNGWCPDSSIVFAPNSTLGITPIDSPTETVARFSVAGRRLVNL